jgi:predicted ATPase/DNA-binding SARP family transcriptional activator
MEFRLLGPLEFAVDGRTVELPAGRPRVLLALLLVEARRVVAAETLIDQLWDGRPPASGPKILQGYVSRLRKLLPAGLLETRSPGYVLHVPNECLDLARFERDRSEAVALTARGEHALAAACLRQALALWRGPALADVADELALAPVARRLDELRLVVLEQRLEAELTAGAGGELVPELEALVAANPLRERMRAQLMLALYRSGRQAEALAAYRDARTTLVDELGLDPSQSLQELETAILNHDPRLDPAAPPPSPRQRTNLPVPASSFVGRERELEELEALVQDGVRLLTLTGPGGSGKTRLALAAATESADAFPDGVWWVPLASVHDPGLVLSSVALALGVAEQPGRGLEETLTDALSAGRALLLLDNLEQLLPGAAAPVAALRDAGGATVVVTSRERLRLAGERVYPVAPLAARDAAELFFDRAAALGADAGDPEEVTELCSRLDNLPLAVELAAARAGLLTPAEMLARLGGRLDQASGGRDSDPRQQTLRNAIAWSHDLLDQRERELFARFAVFAGGATLEAIEAICDPDLGVLASLLDKSLIRRSGERIWMLETIREFAHEQLEALGEAPTISLRHAHWYRDRVLAFAPERDGPSAPELFAWYRQEQANTWAALDTLLNLAPDDALALANELGPYWAAQGETQHGYEWLRNALRGRTPLARDYQRLGYLAHQIGDVLAAQDNFAHALALAEASEDAEAESRALEMLCVAAWIRGEYRQGVDYGERAMTAAKRLSREDELQLSRARNAIAHPLIGLGQLDEARQLLNENRASYAATGNAVDLAITDQGLASVEILQGRLSEARDRLEATLATWERLQIETYTVGALLALGALEVGEERHEEAIRAYARAIDAAHRAGDPSETLLAILGIATAASASEPRTSARLWAAASRQLERRHTAPWDPFRIQAAVAIDTVKATLGDAEYEHEFQSGEALTLHQATAAARQLATSMLT